MTKTKKRIVIDPDQLSLFAAVRNEKQARFAAAPGWLCVSIKLQGAVKTALKQAPKSRETIADEMSAMTGQEITIHMLNSWCSEAHPHRLPAELIPALCEATGCTEPLQVLCDASSLYVLPGPDALRSEIQKLDEEAKRLQKERHKRMLFLKELEGAES